MSTRVVHKREPHDVYVGRPSVWGNPFSHLPHSAAQFRVASRAEAIAKRARRELRGKVLGCWCSPLPCHGDVLARVADEEEDPLS